MHYSGPQLREDLIPLWLHLKTLPESAKHALTLELLEKSDDSVMSEDDPEETVTWVNEFDYVWRWVKGLDEEFEPILSTSVEDEINGTSSVDIPSDASSIDIE